MLTVFSYLINDCPNKPEELRFIYNALDIIQLPAQFAGFLVSGNVHMPNVFAVYLVLFLSYLLLIWCVTVLLMLVRAKKNGAD